MKLSFFIVNVINFFLRSYKRRVPYNLSYHIAARLTLLLEFSKGDGKLIASKNVIMKIKLNFFVRSSCFIVTSFHHLM